MSMMNRAAQFAPFAALSGHDSAINETSRLTSSMSELSDDEVVRLNKRLYHAIQLRTAVTVTYFVRDDRKSGGKYMTAKGIIKKIDEYEESIIFTDKLSIPLADMLSIDGDIFNDFDD